MGGFGEKEAVAIVESTADFSPLDRAVHLFALIRGISANDAADAPIAERDLALFEFHLQIFGETVRFVEQCQECGQTLEGNLELHQVIEAAKSAPRSDRVRSPSSRQIAQIVNGAERSDILAECVGDRVESETDIETAEAAIEEAYPHIDVRLPLTCDACSAEQESRFDIGAFLWPRLEEIANAWLDSVHILASAYGWSEGDIAALSPRRRAQYIARVAR